MQGSTNREGLLHYEHVVLPRSLKDLYYNMCVGMLKGSPRVKK